MPDVPLVLRDALLPSGATVDVRCARGMVTAVGPAVASDDDRVLGLDGMLLLPAPVEPHAHLDKALLGRRHVNRTGDLPGAVAAMAAAYPTMTTTDVLDRARGALRTAVTNGFTAVRSHVDCRAEAGTASLEVLAVLRDQLADVLTLQLVALAGYPLTGRAGADNRRLLAEAVARGADVVGGAPALDGDPAGAIRECAALAADSGLPLDLHVDETTDPAVATLETFAATVARYGLGGRSTASHCVSLASQPPDTRRRTAAALAEAGVAVVCLPQTNLYLQGRRAGTPPPRGLTAVADLRAAGVTVAGGGDNWRDPFNPLGRIDPFETAALLVAAAHLDADAAYAAVADAPRAALGLPAVRVEPGYPADLLAVRAGSVVEAVAAAPTERMVFRGGRLVSAIRVVRDLGPLAVGDLSAQV